MTDRIKRHSVVAMHYVLTDDAGDVLDASQEDDPLVYLHGSGALISGLESKLEGRSAGETLLVTVHPKDGYGELDLELLQTVPIDVFEGIPDIAPGMQLRTEEEDGSSRIITVTAVEGDQVAIDSNHPLAGVTLHFKVEILEVRDATADEISHGHAH